MTDPTIATREEMLSALEKWVRARGWLRMSRRGSSQGVDGWEESAGHPWDVVIEQGIVWLGARRPYTEHRVTPEIAIAWALTVEAGLAAVDVGLCKQCRGRGHYQRWAQGLPKLTWSEAKDEADSWAAQCYLAAVIEEIWVARTAGQRRLQPGESLQDHYVTARFYRAVRSHQVTCPDCNGNGRDLRDPARLVLDAAPQWEHGEDHGRLGQEPPRCDGPGDKQARNHLAVIADELLARGQMLGVVLSLALSRESIGDDRDTRLGVEALTRAWERLTVPCERCEGVGSFAPRLVRFDGSPPVWGEETDGPRNHCPDCNGHGRVRPTRLAEPDGPITVADLDPRDGRCLRLLREALAAPGGEAIVDAAHSQEWHLEQLPENRQDDTGMGLVIRYRWLSRGGWRLRADVHVDTQFQLVRMGRVSVRMPGTVAAASTPEAPHWAGRGPDELITRLLASVDAGDLVFEVDPRSVVGQQRVYAERHRPGPIGSILDTTADPTQTVPGQIERFAFDIITVVHQGQRRAFAAREGTDDGLRLRIVHALLSLNDPATLARIVDRLR